MQSEYNALQNSPKSKAYSNAISLGIAFIICFLTYPIFLKAFHSLGLVIVVLMALGAFLVTRRYALYYLRKMR